MIDVLKQRWRENLSMSAGGVSFSALEPSAAGFRATASPMRFRFPTPSDGSITEQGRCLERQGILERLNAGEVVVGDGGYVMQLERRGYVKAGHWTPEAAVEHPEAGDGGYVMQLERRGYKKRQLHREFLRAGANVIQTFTFYCSEDKLEISGNVKSITGAQINEAADMAREVANEGDALVAGCVSKTPCYVKSHSEPEVKAIFKKQMDDFMKKNIDFFIVEV
ncbi:hypothetical protein F7725_012685 [Dissostichus mawsoni]|uniref:Hcy-binding domain-containing protein n=1 Tax=Dissostichus mawsoni TaxID=36200 RepID=A0A7J5YP54_DISMA|nr:hypothetical protein F7725_012685 [Dissostichus mawsoni]